MDELLEMAADDTTGAGAAQSGSTGFIDTYVAANVATMADGSACSAWPVKTEANTGAAHAAAGSDASSMMVVDNAPAASTTAQPAPKAHLQIMDFTPAQDHQVGGGTKVLIILAREIPPELHRNQIYVSILVVPLTVCHGYLRFRT
jgi:hypothetical protein